MVAPSSLKFEGGEILAKLCNACRNLPSLQTLYSAGIKGAMFHFTVWQILSIRHVISSESHGSQDRESSKENQSFVKDCTGKIYCFGMFTFQRVLKLPIL